MYVYIYQENKMKIEEKVNLVIKNKKFRISPKRVKKN
jgi:hypothetical protein